MTNKTITGLTAATLPVAGTELVPVWDGTGTKKVTIANLGPGLAGIAPTAVTGTALVSAAIGTTVQPYDADLVTWAGITPGTGVGTALAVNVGTAGSFITNGGALGTPSSGSVTNLTGTASININGTVGATTPATGAFTALSAVESITNYRRTSGNNMDYDGYNGSGVGTAGILTRIRTDGDGISNDYGALSFWTGRLGSIALREVLRILSSGEAKFLLGVAVGNATPAASGIAFPATQVAVADANTLDDYEEGTWTPSQGAGLTVVGTFSSSGTYTKIGRLVTLRASVSGSTTVALAANDTVICGNIPFTPTGSTPVRNIGGMTNNTNSAFGAVSAIGSFTTIYNIGTIAATTDIHFTVVYFVLADDVSAQLQNIQDI